MRFRLVPKSVTLNDLERRNGSYFFVILPNLVVSKAHCTNVVDKAITIDNLRLLCLLVNVCKRIARRPLYKFKTLCAARTTCLYELSIGTEIGDLEWPWTAKWSLFCVILPNLVASGAHCVKVIGKAITMDNLRLLCLVVNVCRDAMCLCFFHTISQNRISQKRCSYKHQTWHRNVPRRSPEIRVFWVQKVKGQGHKSQKHCRRGSSHCCECWLLLASPSGSLWWTRLSHFCQTELGADPINSQRL